MAHPYSAVLPAARLFHNREKPACPEYGSGRAGNGGTCKKCSLQSRRKEICSHERAGSPELQGNGICRLRTSSGEYINPRTSLTAAHKTLPLPCKVKVTCLKTGKSVIVRINNRGPFHSNRLIDLTSAAAHRINLNGRGVGKVRLEVISVGDGNYEIFAR